MDKKVLNKKVLIGGGIALGVIVLAIVLVMVFKKEKPVEEEQPKEEVKKLEVKKYDLQTHEYFEKAPSDTKYMINTVDELNVFYYLYSDVLNIDDKELKDYTIFIEVKEANSGSILYKFLDVNIGGKVNFVIDEDIPEVGTDDMAFWYFVAMIPNDKLANVDISDWAIPSIVMEKNIALKEYEFNMDSDDKFVIITDTRFKTMRNDGGSHDNVYYQVDLANKVVTKFMESYNANLGSKATTTTVILYAKRIDAKLAKELKNTLISIANSNDSGKNENYSCYTLKTINFSKDYYDQSNIDNILKVIAKFE